MIGLITSITKAIKKKRSGKSVSFFDIVSGIDPITNTIHNYASANKSTKTKKGNAWYNVLQDIITPGFTDLQDTIDPKMAVKDRLKILMSPIDKGIEYKQQMAVKKEDAKLNAEIDKAIKDLTEGNNMSKQGKIVGTVAKRHKLPSYGSVGVTPIEDPLLKTETKKMQNQAKQLMNMGFPPQVLANLVKAGITPQLIWSGLFLVGGTVVYNVLRKNKKI